MISIIAPSEVSIFDRTEINFVTVAAPILLGKFVHRWSQKAWHCQNVTDAPGYHVVCSTDQGALLAVVPLVLQRRRAGPRLRWMWRPRGSPSRILVRRPRRRVQQIKNQPIIRGTDFPIICVGRLCAYHWK